MRISDWSSDVCSSDLGLVLGQALGHGLGDRGGEVRPVAVEVAAAALLVAPGVVAVDELGEAVRVGVGHQLDLAGNAAASLGLFQHAIEVKQHQQPHDRKGGGKGKKLVSGEGTRGRRNMKKK